LCAAFVALVAVAGAAGLAWERGRSEAEADRAEAVADLATGRHEDAARAAGRGRSRIADLPFLSRLDSELASLSRSAERGLAAGRLRHAAERCRFLGEVSSQPAAAGELASLCEES
jgi:hypothetical protein